MRSALNLFANIRPVKIRKSLINASSLKKEVVENVDLIVVRELIGGIYFGKPRGLFTNTKIPKAFNTMVYDSSEIERIAEIAIKIANQIGRKRKMSISEGAGYIAHIQGMLDNIDAERDSLVALHQHVLKRVSKTVDGEFESYNERSIVHTILEDPSRPLDLDRVARDLLIHSKDMQMVIDGIRGHLANTNTEEIFMPADSTTPLPWWIQG